MGLRRLLAAAAVAAPLVACGDADAARDGADAGADTAVVAGAALPTVRAGALTVSHAVAPAPIADAPMALYLEVANAGPAADTLLGIAVPGGSATLHETVGGAMRPVERLPIPAAGAVALRPGGLHAMLEGAARPATPGDTLRATLRFARAGEVAIAAPVVPYADLERRLGTAGSHAGH